MNECGLLYEATLRVSRQLIHLLSQNACGYLHFPGVLVQHEKHRGLIGFADD